MRRATKKAPAEATHAVVDRLVAAKEDGVAELAALAVARGVDRAIRARAIAQLGALGGTIAVRSLAKVTAEAGERASSPTIDQVRYDDAAVGDEAAIQLGRLGDARALDRLCVQAPHVTDGDRVVAAMTCVLRAAAERLSDAQLETLETFAGAHTGGYYEAECTPMFDSHTWVEEVPVDCAEIHALARAERTRRAGGA